MSPSASDGFGSDGGVRLRLNRSDLHGSVVMNRMDAEQNQRLTQTIEIALLRLAQDALSSQEK